MITEYDIKWIEDAVKKAITPFTIKMADIIMSSINWDSTKDLKMIYPHFKNDLDLRKKQYLKEQDAADGNTVGIMGEARKSS